MMCEVSTDRPTEGDVRCPTCGARQEWSDACRRCKCDLTLLREVAHAVQATRCRCMRLLRAGRVQEALREARRLYVLSPDHATARLLAVCRLLHGDWAAAITAAQNVGF